MVGQGCSSEETKFEQLTNGDYSITKGDCDPLQDGQTRLENDSNDKLAKA